MRLAMLLTLASSLVACSGGTPTSPEDCAGLPTAKQRDECYLIVVGDVFKKDADAGIKLVETQIEDQTNKDFAWYTVTRNVDPHSNKYCDRIKDPTLADRCRKVVARPHLNRELKNRDGLPQGNLPPPDPSKPAVDN